MDSNREALNVAAVEWCEEAALILAPSVPFGSVDDLREQTKTAGAVLFRVSRGVDLVGYYLLRVDTGASGAEGVLVAAAGRDGFDLTAHLLPHIESQFLGCNGIRIHTARPGLAKKLTTRNGYGAAELVLRKQLK